MMIIFFVLKDATTLVVFEKITSEGLRKGRKVR